MWMIEEYSMNFKDREFQALLMVTVRFCTIGRTNTFYGIRENPLVEIECSQTCSGIRQDHGREPKALKLDLRIEGMNIPGLQYWFVVLIVYYVCCVREGTSSSFLLFPLADLPGKVRGALYVLLASPFLLFIFSLCRLL
jgi:hypothetical protein